MSDFDSDSEYDGLDDPAPSKEYTKDELKAIIEAHLTGEEVDTMVKELAQEDPHLEYHLFELTLGDKLVPFASDLIPSVRFTIPLLKREL